MANWMRWLRRGHHTLARQQAARDEAVEALEYERQRQQELAVRVEQIETEARPLLEQVRFLRAQRRQGRDS